MNILRETFQLIYAGRLKRGDPLAALGALIGTTVFACLNVLVFISLTDPVTGFFTWLDTHGTATLVTVSIIGIAIGVTQYFCWIANDRLKEMRAQIKSGAPQRKFRVYAYIAVSILAIPAAGIFSYHLRNFAP